MDGTLNDPNIFSRRESADVVSNKIEEKIKSYSELRNQAEKVIAEREVKSEYNGLDGFKKDVNEFRLTIHNARVDVNKFRQGENISREDLQKILKDLEWWEDKVRRHLGLPRTTTGTVLDFEQGKKRKRA